MLNIKVQDPLTLAIIGFIVIFFIQYYNKKIKNKKDDDDYDRECDIITLVKVPLLTALLIWLICNFLIQANKNNYDNNLDINLEPIANIESLNNQVNSITKQKVQLPIKDISLKDIFTEQPNF